MKRFKRLLLVMAAVCFFIVSYAGPYLKAESNDAIYTNHWPAFTISYPDHWIEKKPEPRFIFKAESPDEYPVLRIAAIPEHFVSSMKPVDLYLSEIKKYGYDINVIYDRDVSMEDGTKARETIIKWTPHDLPKQTTLIVNVRARDVWIVILLSSVDGEIGEDLKKVPYSLKLKPLKEVPVTYQYKIPEKTDGGWPTAQAAEVNLDEKKLSEFITKIQNDTYPAQHSVLIVKNGKLVLEEYFPGRDYRRFHVNFTRDSIHQVMSVTKSFTSTLIGIAIDKGMINGTDEKLISFFPEYNQLLNANAKREITLKQVLSMTAGFDWNETTYLYNDPRNPTWKMYGSERDNIVGYILGRPLKNRPGSKWVYNSGLSALLGVILEKKTGLKVTEFTDKYLFGPLGITKYIWGYMDFEKKVPRTGGGLFLCPRDMAKLGQLFLNKGRWNGRRIVSASWVEESTKAHIKLHPKGIIGYGYQWWRYRFKQNAEFIDTYVANGWGGQRIFVIPELDMVVVFTAGNHSVPHRQVFSMIYTMISGYIIPAAAGPS